MFKKIILSIIIISAGIFLIRNEAVSFSSGAPDAHTGSPYDAQTCVVCHYGAPVNVLPNVISSTVPATGFVPGNTYTINVQFPRFGHTTFGFQISPQDTAGNILGSMIETNTETQLTGFGLYMTHSFIGTTGTDTKNWSFDWVAPSTVIDSVTFYGAFNAANGNGSNNGDTIFTSTHTVYVNSLAIKDAAANPHSDITVFPNPVTDHFTLRFKDLEGELKLSIFNMKGEKCFEQNNRVITKGDISTTISLDKKMEAGNYLVDGFIGKQKFTKNIIIL